MKIIDDKPGASLVKHFLLVFASACCVLEAAYLVKPILDTVARLSSKAEPIYFVATERWEEYEREIALLRELIHETNRKADTEECSENPPSAASINNRCDFSASGIEQCAR
jgi:hypothetical protein